MSHEDMSVLSLAKRLPMKCGYTIPQIGFGVYQTPAIKCAEVVTHALKNGYRHVDTAAGYRNENATCAAFAQFLKDNPTVTRNELFYTTKLAPKFQGYKKTTEAIQTQLSFIRSPPDVQDVSGPAPSPYSRDARNLVKNGHSSVQLTSSPENNKSLEYIDLYLIHCPASTPKEREGTWRAMVEAQKRGEIRSLGVSNYGVHHLEELETFIKKEEERGVREGRGEGWGGTLSVWQGEIHPWISRHDIRKWCEDRNVVIEAYSPLTRGMWLDSDLLKPFCEKYGKTPAQILLRWSLQVGFVPLPKSVTLERIVENVGVYDFEMTPEELKTLDTGEYKPTGWDPTVWR